MVRKLSISGACFLLLLAFVFVQCSHKSDPQPTTGEISGKVTDFSSSNALGSAIVILFDASTNTPVNSTTTTTDGTYSISAVTAGNYFLKFYKQGYLPVPAPEATAISFAVTAGQTSTQDAQMTASTVSNAGYITGKITFSGKALAGVLVAAEGTNVAYTGISDKDGNYSIFNVPAGNYNIKGYIADYSAPAVSASVTANNATSGVNVTMNSGVSGTVAGSMSVVSQTTIATQPATMDISLVHPITKETIPGLSQNIAYSSSLTFSFSKVPDGNYIVRASYANDYIIMDPDRIAKFGDYKVTVSGATPNPSTVSITATSAVILNSPTNAMTTTVPIAASSTPTFTWSSYPSTSDYVIEVMDASTGQIVWGGFTGSGTSITKNITLASSTTSVKYNSDGKASIASLVSGKVYRWRIYASKNQVAAPGWGLIAASEDQIGLIKIN